MGNTGTPVDGVGLRLLGVEAPDDDGPEIRPLVFALTFPFAGLGLLYSAFRTPGLDRVSVVSRVLYGMLFLGLGHTAGAWGGRPAVRVGPGGAGVLGAATAAALTRWPGLPLSAKPVRWHTWLSPAIPAALLIGFTVVLVT
ncbi:hypothetical protein ACFSTC_50085 [Nonomuraea ferruginea]